MGCSRPSDSWRRVPATADGGRGGRLVMGEACGLASDMDCSRVGSVCLPGRG